MAKLHPDQAAHTAALESIEEGPAPTPARHLDTGSDDPLSVLPNAGSPDAGSPGAGSEDPDGSGVVNAALAADQHEPAEPTNDGVAAADHHRVASLTERRRTALAEARRTGLPPKVDSWRKRTATGAVLTGFALGFREALGLEPQRPAIVMEAPGDPPTDLPVDAEVGQIRPADNVVRIRPWLLPTGQEPAVESDGSTVGSRDAPGAADAPASRNAPGAADAPASPGALKATDKPDAAESPDALEATDAPGAADAPASPGALKAANAPDSPDALNLRSNYLRRRGRR